MLLTNQISRFFLNIISQERSDKQMSIKVFHKLILSFWVCMVRHAQKTQNKKFACLWNIRKTWGMKLIFCPQINMKVFYKLIVSLGLCVVRYAQSTQNKGFAISLQCLKENMKDEADFFCLQTNIKGFSN